MGVRGLTTFVENNQRSLLSRKKLNHSSLVIDGFGLLYHLYFNLDLDARFGGEYEDFSRVVSRFLDQLAACSIKAHVIFDGPVAAEKLECVIQRLKDRVSEVNKMLRNGRNAKCRVLPLFAVDVFQQCLIDHMVPFSISLNDADAEIVAVSNNMNCPVLGEDSDYFIYNVMQGYLPLSYFHWKETFTDQISGRHIVCQEYNRTSMTREFGINESALPFVSILLGNDWISRDTFSQLPLQTQPVQSSKTQKRKKSKKPEGRTGIVIQWISVNWETDSSMKKKLSKSLSKTEKDDVMGRVEDCLNLYKELPDVTGTMKILTGTDDDNLISSRTTASHEMNKIQIESDVKKGILHPLALDMLDLNIVLLPVVTSNPWQPSPHDCAMEIRTSLYSHILRKHCVKTAESSIFSVQEFDRVGVTYKNSRWLEIDTSLCTFCDRSHTIEDKDCSIHIHNQSPTKDSVTVLTDIILRTLKLNLKEKYLVKYPSYETSIFSEFDVKFQSHLQLVIMGTLFWLKKTFPSPLIVCSVLLSLVWSIHKWKNRLKEDSTDLQTVSNPNSEELSQRQTQGHCTEQNPMMNLKNVNRGEYEIAIEDFLNLFGTSPLSACGTLEEEDCEVDIDLLHSSSEWQCVLYWTSILNQVLSQERRSIVDGLLSSSIVLQKIYHRIQRLVRQKKTKRDLNSMCILISERLSSISAMKKSFELLKSFLLQQSASDG